MQASTRARSVSTRRPWAPCSISDRSDSDVQRGIADSLGSRWRARLSLPPRELDTRANRCRTSSSAPVSSTHIADDAMTTVICLPGFASHHMVMKPISSALSAHGFDAPCWSWPWYRPDENVDSIVSRLLPKVAEAATLHEVILLGHSMGGVLAVLIAQQLGDCNGRLAGIVSIAAPLGGTRWASIAIGPARAATETFTNTPPPVPLIALAGSRDRIAPLSTALPLWASQRHATEDTHASILFSAHAKRLIVEACSGMATEECDSHQVLH